MRLQHSFLVSASPTTVAGVLCDEAYNLETERGRNGVIQCTFEVLRRDQAGVVFHVRTTEYARTRTGAVDPSRTFASITRNELIASDQVLRWAYDPELGTTRTSLSGLMRLTPEGSSTRVTHDVSIEVGIPLIGSQIAKLLAAEFRASFPRVQRVLQAHAAGRVS